MDRDETQNGADRQFPKDLERRTFHVEVRADGEDGPRKIVGYAAKFGVESQPLWGFTEIIRKDAFTKAIETSDVRALWNHNDDIVLGRTKSGTLELRQDEVGLYIEITPPDTQQARDLMVSIERGDVDQMSFAFGDVTDRRTDEGDRVLRELIEIRRLYDVSPVTYPAYEETEVYIRKLVLGHELTDAEKAALRARIGDTPSAADKTAARERIEGQLDEENSRSSEGKTEAAPAGRSDASEEPGEGREAAHGDGAPAGPSADVRRRELEMMELF